MLTPLRAARQAIPLSSCVALARCVRPWVPAVTAAIHQSPPWAGRRQLSSITRQRQRVAALDDGKSLKDELPPGLSLRELAKKLPVVCPGCGAPSQTVDADAAGFYGSKRALKTAEKNSAPTEEDLVFANALASGLLSQPVPPSPRLQLQEQAPPTPICERCHNLLYQSRGNSILHPSMQSIQRMVEESPHKHNHIYHVLDAADFPLSLIPNLISSLHLPRLRTQNRRSKSMHYVRGRVAEISFIITRSDLLAPKKEQVDSLVPYLREVLRESLGRSGRNIRLGMVRCVSAQRGWWTRAVKEEIYNRGGAGWVVGKVNVGKSALFEVVFPKGRDQGDVNVKSVRDKEQRDTAEVIKRVESSGSAQHEPIRKTTESRDDGFVNLPGEMNEPQKSTIMNYNPNNFQESELDISNQTVEDEDNEVILDDTSLLPPAQPETPFPRMPLVSSLPGTTASPIRIPFGNGKGELIDLPGVHRSSLDIHVNPEHRSELLMKSRVVPEQHTIKPGQSLLLGGLIRILPKTDDLIVLAYPFVPLTPHVTATNKAIGIQTGTYPDELPYDGNVPTIATDAAKSSMQSAGTFKLEWDVTKRRTGPLTDRAAGKQKPANLPFVIYGADILIEGVGWVEVTCQVRSRRKETTTLDRPLDAFDEEQRRMERSNFPEVEVFSPDGKFVGVRRPMNAWVLGGPKKLPKHKQRLRPRQTISFQRRKEGGARGGKLKIEND